jgi:hypothetical protein
MPYLKNYFSVNPMVTDEQFFGVYLGKQKVGYTSYSETEIDQDGKPALRTTTTTRLKLGLIGSEVEMKIDSETVSIARKTFSMHFVTQSAGRQQIVDAWYSPTAIKVKVDNNGEISNHTLVNPTDAEVVDDPLTFFALHPAPSGTKKVVYVFDPTTVSLIKNTIRVGPMETISIANIITKANTLIIEDPRLETKVHVSDKGDILKVSTSLGIEMMPLSKEAALAGNAPGGAMPDLAELMRVVPNEPIANAENLTLLRIRLTSDVIKSLPSDQSQSVKKDGKTWLVNIKPTQLLRAPTKTISQAAAAQTDWLKPSLNIPSDKQMFVKLAAEITGKNPTLRDATLKIRRYVNQTMRPNAGIGVLRDATEVLATKEGVCRDYAILTATLCRSAGIPARLASGLVSWDGNFYYHAWVEVFTGYEWVGVDSISNSDQFSASHVKLSQGNVDKAFNFTVLSGVKMEVLDVKS